MPHDGEGQRREVWAGGGRARGGHELALEVVAEDGEPAHVIGVLVGEKDGADVAHVQPELLRPGEKCPARDAAVHEHGPLGPLYDGGVSLGAAGQDVQVDLGGHGRPLAVVHSSRAAPPGPHVLG